MYRKVLVPLDGSELAEVALDYAGEIGRRLGLELVLLHVYKPGESESAFMRRAYLDHLAETLECKTAAVAGSGVQTECKPVTATSVLKEGYPAEEILRFADKNEVDAVLMATHGHSGVRHWALGGTADKVVRASEVPVWLVRAALPREALHEHTQLRTVMVPLDGSESSESTLPHVQGLAENRGYAIEITLVHVCEPPLIRADYPAEMPYSWEEHVRKLTETRKESCRGYLDGVRERLAGLGLNVRAEVLLGNAADEIIKYDHEWEPDLVAMATHGYSGPGTWAFGSVAERVLQGGSSPLLLVRPEH